MAVLLLGLGLLAVAAAALGVLRSWRRRLARMPVDDGRTPEAWQHRTQALRSGRVDATP